MEYIPEESCGYITNKYHDTAKPFDSFKRFIRRDELFESDSGLCPEEIYTGIEAQDEMLAALPHPIRKAMAFEYVLRHTRISCDSRDIFPAINMIDRPLNATVIKKWKTEIFEERIPNVWKKRDQLNALGVADLIPDYDHSVPMWDRLFARGFRGILEESEAARWGKALTAEQDAFYEGIRITYSAIIDFIGRLEAQASKTKGSERMAAALRRIQNAPPVTFYEALLFDYVYFMLSEHIEGLQVRSLSHFDRLFYPYFKRDLENGIPEESLRRDLAYFFLQFASIGNYWNQPVYLGGCRADESTEINALSYLFLDVYDKMKLYNPKIQIKVAESTPKEFLLKALDMIRRGHNSIVLVNDAMVRASLMRNGATADQARRADIRGCYEHSVPGGMSCAMNYLNLMKPLEYALHEGRDGVCSETFGLPAPSVDKYESFDAFYGEYKRQLCHLIDEVVETVNAYEDHLAEINPQSMLSATYPSCLESGKDALCGGAVMNNTVMNVGFLASAADSLTMLRKYVFDRHELTLSKFRNILDRNFEGHERFRARLLADRDKYGNNKDLPDSIAKDLVDFLVGYITPKCNAKRRAGKWIIEFHAARHSYKQGKKTAASPDGRGFGEELSKNCSASMGQNREGATAAILSVTKLDATSCGEMPLDLGLLPSAVTGEEGLVAMYGLVKTFMRRGGHAIHINVFDGGTLRDAQKNPDKYRDLQIRVCGWNVLWNNICKTEQDAFIRQAESLV